MKRFFSLVLVFAVLFSGDAYAAFKLFSRKTSGQEKAAVVKAADGLTLRRAYELALARSETVAISAKVIDEAQAHFYQALDVIMPKANFVMTRQEQDAGKDPGEGGVGGSLTRRTTPQKKFVFSQPIFSGFKEIAALQGAGAEKRQRKYEYERAKQLLFVDVMDAFYSLLEAQKDLELLRATHRLLEERTQELKQRAELGRSRQSEVETGIAELKVDAADLIEAEQAEQVFRQLLEFYLGETVAGSLVDEAIEPALPRDEYLRMAVSRVDVRAAEEAHVLSQKRMLVAQSGLFPSVTLDGNYYTERVGFQSGIDWDILFTVDVPLFTGTQVIGDIKEAASLRDREELNVSRTRRTAILDVQNAYARYDASQRRSAALGEANDALKRNYEIQAEEYRSNLVNNLQVLDALRRYQDIARQYNTAHAQSRRDYWQLRIAAGESVFGGEVS